MGSSTPSSCVGNDDQADAITDEGYDAWLMVVDENGKVSSITQLDKTGGALSDAAGRPIAIPAD
ncbi:hypothetical protein [Burkholderia sp. WSM2232]|uniref:hypothetical protein n=1 Tax=Burkholderia sp. WSM2232 TaxID=944436 RepID=UPI00040006CC|nr:hypothetical protein [Burkholderia sp. WSM2232]